MRFLAVALLAACADAVIKVGDTLPAVTLDYGFPPEKVNLLERSKGKKIILMGLPGAFTPT
jgi:2-Cys peroxiredoxin 5